MYSLAINTAIEPYGVSVLQNENILGEVYWYFSKTKKNEHLYAIDYLFKRYDLNFEKIMFITLVSGPGSFTGLKIGFSVVKTLGFLYKTPISLVSTFEAVTNFIDIKNFIIVINAGLKEVFVFKENVIKIDKFDNLKEYKEIKIFTEFYLYKNYPLKDKIYFQISAGNVGIVGLIKFKDGNFEDAKNINPNYLREPESIFKTYKED